MKSTVISHAIEKCTACMDVIKMLEYKGDDTVRDFALYVTFQYDHNAKETEDIYYMIIEGDEYPIVVSPDTAKEILNNPELGESIAYNLWFNRHR